LAFILNAHSLIGKCGSGKQPGEIDAREQYD